MVTRTRGYSAGTTTDTPRGGSTWRWPRSWPFDRAKRSQRYEAPGLVTGLKGREPPVPQRTGGLPRIRPLSTYAMDNAGSMGHAPGRTEALIHRPADLHALPERTQTVRRTPLGRRLLAAVSAYLHLLRGVGGRASLEWPITDYPNRLVRGRLDTQQGVLDRGERYL